MSLAFGQWDVNPGLFQQMIARQQQQHYGNLAAQLQQYKRHEPKPSIEPRSSGPACPCHGKRNMERMGYCLYRCHESGETSQMLVHDGHIAMVPLETGKALEELK